MTTFADFADFARHFARSPYEKKSSWGFSKHPSKVCEVCVSSLVTTPPRHHHETGRHSARHSARHRAEQGGRRCSTPVATPRRDDDDTRRQTRPTPGTTHRPTPRRHPAEQGAEQGGRPPRQGPNTGAIARRSLPRRPPAFANICTTPGATSPMAAGHCPNSGRPVTRERGAERAPSEPASKASSGPPARPRPVGGSPWGGRARHHAWHNAEKKRGVPLERHAKNRPCHAKRDPCGTIDMHVHERHVSESGGTGQSLRPTPEGQESQVRTAQET